MNIRTQNQLHPHKKKNRESVPINPIRRVFYKDGDSSMLLCKDVTPNAAKVLVHSIRENAKNLGISIKGNFIITQ